MTRKIPCEGLACKMTIFCKLACCVSNLASLLQSLSRSKDCPPGRRLGLVTIASEVNEALVYLHEAIISIKT